MSNVCGEGCGTHDDACFDRMETEARIVAHDPVCGKKLDCESTDARKLKWEDAVFFFCSTKCMTDFINDPKKYTKKKGFFGFLKRWN